MRKSEKEQLVILADQAIDKAFLKYDEVISDLEKEEQFSGSDLSTCIKDSLKNLSRKLEAYLGGKISLSKLVDEFIFEHQIVREELEVSKDEPQRLRRLAKRLLSSYEDFISKVGGSKKVRQMALPASGTSVEYKSKKKAYLLWFCSIFGILGFHRFYLGRTGTGIFWILSGGVAGIGALYDLFALGMMVEEENTRKELHEARIKRLTEGKKTS